MSTKTLPLLFINLGGEMLYILDQRLRAQNIPPDKAKKVMHDISGTMLNMRFMEELFKPQDVYSKKAMRTVFDRLAHASIMRLNSASMDKLYDLMTMAFKYQISLCLRPSDILLVTFNHMDAIRDFVDSFGPIKEQVDNAYRLLIEHFASLTPGEFMLVRQTLLNFFEDMHIRVSIFLKDKVQSSNGRFVLPTSGEVGYGIEVPGTIKHFSGGKVTSQTTFNSGGKYEACRKEGSFGVSGDRVTKLGTNMYNVVRPADTTSSSPPAATANAPQSAVPEPDYGSGADPRAKQQLDLLSKLIGSSGGGQKSAGFRLNLFSTDEEEEEAATLKVSADPGSQVVNIDASKKMQSRELTKIMGELKVENRDDREDDLLELMDSTQ